MHFISESLWFSELYIHIVKNVQIWFHKLLHKSEFLVESKQVAAFVPFLLSGDIFVKLLRQTLIRSLKKNSLITLSFDKEKLVLKKRQACYLLQDACGLQDVHF